MTLEELENTLPNGVPEVPLSYGPTRQRIEPANRTS
jgi:hypothetical protein